MKAETTALLTIGGIVAAGVVALVATKKTAASSSSSSSSSNSNNPPPQMNPPAAIVGHRYQATLTASTPSGFDAIPTGSLNTTAVQAAFDAVAPGAVKVFEILHYAGANRRQIDVTVDLLQPAGNPYIASGTFAAEAGTPGASVTIADLGPSPAFQNPNIIIPLHPPGQVTWVKSAPIQQGQRVRATMSLTTVTALLSGLGIPLGTTTQQQTAAVLSLLLRPQFASIIGSAGLSIWVPGAPNLPVDWPPGDPNLSDGYHFEFVSQSPTAVPFLPLPVVAYWVGQ